MSIQKFRAPNIRQALQVVKKQLGPEAIILSIQAVTAEKGTPGARAVVEITATLDDEQAPTAGAAPIKAAAPLGKGKNNGSGTRKPEEITMDLLYQELSRIRLQLENITDNLKVDSVNHQLQNFSQDFNEIKRQVGDLAAGGSPHGLGAGPYAEGELGELYQKLRLTGVHEDFAKELIDVTLEKLTKKRLPPDMYGMEYLAATLMDQVRLAAPFRPVKEQKIHMVIGPTGVGKTTTIAKLAAQQVFEFGKTVALLTVDTYRIGAIEQLRTYSKILNVPMEVCLSDVELVEAVRQYADKDVLFIDTAGASQKDARMIGELAKVYQSGVPMDIHLIVSATTSEGDLNDIYQRYRVMPLNSLIVSKLDEANRFGTVYNLLQETRIPCSCFTVGQNVPEDIEAASTERIADMLLAITA